VLLHHQAESVSCTLQHRTGILDQTPRNGFVEGQAPSVLPSQGRNELQSCFEAQRPGELA